MDVISRQDAIEAVGANTWAGFRLEKLPSAQPERKTGHWLWDRGARTCSVCGQMRYIGKTSVKDHYCPNCGAKMEVEQDNGN